MNDAAIGKERLLKTVLQSNHTETNATDPLNCSKPQNRV